MPGETCWFCQKAPAEAGAGVTSPMYGNVQTDRVWDGVQRQRTRWNSRVIVVPRCRACKAVHDRQALQGFGWLGILGFIGLFLGLLFLAFSPAALVLIGLSLLPIWLWRRKFTRGEKDRRDRGIEAHSHRLPFDADVAGG